MVSDEALVEQLREMLRTADLTTTTTANLRRGLEEHFGVELSDKKAFIREQVDLFLRELQSENDGDNGDMEEEGEEEEGDRDRVEEEEQEDEEEGSTSNEKGSGRKGSSGKKNTKRTGGGFTKVCSLSPQLQKFIGESELPRTQVVKRLWAYIRENNLQDPKNKRKIICNEKLHELFNVKTIDMFQMNKALAKHIWPLDPENANSFMLSHWGQTILLKKNLAHCTILPLCPRQRKRKISLRRKVKKKTKMIHHKKKNVRKQGGVLLLLLLLSQML